jgi:uncharacterized protein YceK
MRKIAILFLVLLSAAGCSTKVHRISETIPPTKQLILFQYSYINYAWGYQNRGWFINNHGLAKAYRVRDREAWHDPSTSGPDSGYISSAALFSDSAQAGHTFFEYSHFMLSGMIPHITGAVGGPFSEVTRSAYDAGQMKYSCYYWDDAKGMYKDVLLSLSGDLTQTNLSPDADTLLEWLQGLDLIYQDSLKAWGE